MGVLLIDGMFLLKELLKNPATQPIVQSQHSQENEKTYYLNVAGHNPI
jgi:hypothetical protein